MIPNLAVREGSHEQVTFPHVWEGALSIQRTAHEPVEHAFSQVGCVFPPQVEHLLAVPLLCIVPVSGIALKAIGQLFPHKGGV